MALAKAGTWFFGTIVAIVVVFGHLYKDKPWTQTIGELVFYGFIVGGLVLCKEWYDYEKAEREHELAERRKASVATRSSGSTTL